MKRHLYTLLSLFALPVVLLRLLLRSWKIKEYRQRWDERFACYSQDRGPAGPTLVLHAVSVGELHAAGPLIQVLLSEYAEYRLVITCSTPTGAARIRSLYGDRVEHVYIPYDLPGMVQRFLARFSPELLIMMETELWPNLIHYCHTRGVRLMLANARLSEKSSRNYDRFRALARTMLRQVDLVAAQSAADAQRFQALGLDARRCVVTGNMKYDMVLNEKLLSEGHALRQALFGERPVMIAASTREEEDERVMRAFERVLERCPDTALILVPRHPERFEHAWQLGHKFRLRAWRRSAGVRPSSARDLQFLLGDSMGEMQLYYAMADIAFVGGSLVPTGCQNILEPAGLGLPVLTGPSLYNFKSISDDLQAAGAMRVVADERALADMVILLLNEPGQRAAMADAARRVFAENGGASEKLGVLIAGMLNRR